MINVVLAQIDVCQFNLKEETSFISISTTYRYVNETQEIEIEKLTQWFYSGSVTQTYIHSQGHTDTWFHYEESNYTSTDST